MDTHVTGILSNESLLFMGSQCGLIQCQIELHKLIGTILNTRMFHYGIALKFKIKEQYSNFIFVLHILTSVL